MAVVTDFLALSDYRAETLIPILERASDLASDWQGRRMPQTLEGIRVALIVDDGGWRNTTAFELGTKAMGGVCVASPITLQGQEAVSDLARYLDNWFDIIVARTPHLDRLRELADFARAPVINARTRSNHPCETLGDLAFILAERGTLEGLRIAVVAPDDNILGSWAEAAAVLPLSVTQIYPKRWHAQRFTQVERFSATEDMNALTSADVVITDCWPKGAEADILLPYQITATVLERCAPEVLFIPCPPVTRGQDVSAQAMAAPHCRTIEAKAFLLHAQNALLERIGASLGRPCV